MNHSVVNSIIKPHRTRGESKYMLEEIYFSDLCEDIENKNEDEPIIDINPQKALFHNGQYRYQLPYLWYQSTCNNKAIGLRSIELVPDSVSFDLQITFLKRNEPQLAYQEAGTIHILQQFLPNTSLMEIMSTTAQLIATEKSKSQSLKNLPFRVLWSYSYKTCRAAFSISRGSQVTDPEKYIMKFIVSKTTEERSQCGFCECFNTTEEYVSQPQRYLLFNDVWNRRDLFVHASFVNGTSFQFLGRNGEFYPKPSKMYRFNGNSPDFYFELSHDGIHPIKHKFARFIVQLAFIYNDADYMAE